MNEMQRAILPLLLAAGIMASGGCRIPPLAARLETFRKEERSDPVLQQLARLDRLTLPEAQEIALLRHPGIDAARMRVAAAKLRYFEQAGAYLPEITFSYTLDQTIIDRSGMVNPLSTTPSYENTFSAGGAFQAGWLLFDGLSRLFETLAAREEHASTRRSGMRLGGEPHRPRHAGSEVRRNGHIR